MFGFIIIVLFFILLFVELHRAKNVNELIEKNIQKAIKNFPKAKYERKRWLIPLISVLAGSTVLTIIYAGTLMHFNSKLTFLEAVFTQFTLYAFLVPLIIYVIFIGISIKNNKLYDPKNISEFIKKYFEMNVEKIHKTKEIQSISLSKKYNKNDMKFNIDFCKCVAATIGHSHNATPILISLSLQVTVIFEYEKELEVYQNLIKELEKIHSVKAEYSKNQVICTVQSNSAKNNVYYIYLILQTIDSLLQLI